MVAGNISVGGAGSPAGHGVLAATENDLLRFTSAHPEYVKNSGPKTKAIKAIRRVSRHGWCWVCSWFEDRAAGPGAGTVVVEDAPGDEVDSRPEFALLCVWLTGAVSCHPWHLGASARGPGPHLGECLAPECFRSRALYVPTLDCFFLIVGMGPLQAWRTRIPLPVTGNLLRGMGRTSPWRLPRILEESASSGPAGSETSAWDDYAQTFRPRRLGIVNALALAALAYWTGNVLGKDSGNHVIGAFLLQTGVGFAANGVFWAVKEAEKVSLGPGHRGGELLSALSCDDALGDRAGKSAVWTAR